MTQLNIILGSCEVKFTLISFTAIQTVLSKFQDKLSVLSIFFIHPTA